MKKIKILEIVPSLSQANGVAAYISSYVQNMNKEELEFTFLVLNDRDHGRYQEIINSGGKIIELYNPKRIFRYIKAIKKIYSDGNYDIVHCHTPNYGLLYLFIAKKFGIEHRILHSHVINSADGFAHKIRNSLINPLSVKLANSYIACSEEAGKFLFKNKKFTVIKNSIDISNYIYNEQKRSELRKKYKIEDKIVVGEFGRLCQQKNQLFMIDIFNELLKLNDRYFLILVGNGELESKIKEKIKRYQIDDKVLMLGSRNDVNDLYNALDIFVLPSLYEGLGIVLIEAQANGLHCITSKKNVPIEAKVSNLLSYIDLNNNPKEWADAIQKTKLTRECVEKNIKEKGYDICQNAIYLEEYYKNLMK